MKTLRLTVLTIGLIFQISSFSFAQETYSALIFNAESFLYQGGSHNNELNTNHNFREVRLEGLFTQKIFGVYIQSRINSEFSGGESSSVHILAGPSVRVNFLSHSEIFLVGGLAVTLINQDDLQQKYFGGIKWLGETWSAKLEVIESSEENDLLIFFDAGISLMNPHWRILMSVRDDYGFGMGIQAYSLFNSNFSLSGKLFPHEGNTSWMGSLAYNFDTRKEEIEEMREAERNKFLGD